MTPEALPSVIVVVAMFVAFIGTLAAVHVWSNLP